MSKTNNQQLIEILFMQMEDLNNPDMEEKELKIQIERSKAVVNVAKVVLSSQKLQMKFDTQFRSEGARTSFFENVQKKLL